MKKGTKITLLCIFVPTELFFCLATFVALFMFPPVGFVGLAASTLYLLVIISICQSLKGKKPILNLFREGTKTCKKCGTTYEKAKCFGCPKCAEEKRKNQPPLPTFEEMENARLSRKARKAAFWDFVGAVDVIGELSELNEKPPIKKQSILNSTCYDGEHLHTEEGHEAEDGYCMECDIAVEDVLE